MGLFIAIQVALNLAFVAVATLLFIERSKARRGEDQKVSKGLQLITNKIAVLEDLMDRTETLSRHMTQLLDRKHHDVQEKIEEVELHLHKVDESIKKSKEVAEIFQDKIPHEEIIERKKTVQYLEAAKMAHQGFEVEDISKQFDISPGELELIVKLNRDQLIVKEEPEWTKPSGKEDSATNNDEVADLSTGVQFDDQTLEDESPEAKFKVQPNELEDDFKVVPTIQSTDDLSRFDPRQKEQPKSVEVRDYIRPVEFKNLNKNEESN